MALQKFSSRPEKPKKGNIRFRLQETFRVVNRRGWPFNEGSGVL